MKIYDKYYNYHNFATFLVRIKKKPKECLCFNLHVHKSLNLFHLFILFKMSKCSYMYMYIVFIFNNFSTLNKGISQLFE